MTECDRGPSPLPLQLFLPLDPADSTSSEDDCDDLTMPKLERQPEIKLRVMPPRNLPKPTTSTTTTTTTPSTPHKCPSKHPNSPSKLPSSLTKYGHSPSKYSNNSLTKYGNSPSKYGNSFSKTGLSPTKSGYSIKNSPTKYRTLASKNHNPSHKKKMLSKPFVPDRELRTKPSSKPLVPQSRMSGLSSRSCQSKTVEVTHAEISPAPNNTIDLDKSYMVLVSNLPWDVTKDEIRQHFRRTGRTESVRYVRVIPDKDTVLPSSHAFVQFRDMISYRVAMRLNGTTLRQNTITVERNLNRKKSSTTQLSACKTEPPDNF